MNRLILWMGFAAWLGVAGNAAYASGQCSKQPAAGGSSSASTPAATTATARTANTVYFPSYTTFSTAGFVPAYTLPAYTVPAYTVPTYGVAPAFTFGAVANVSSGGCAGGGNNTALQQQLDNLTQRVAALETKVFGTGPQKQPTPPGVRPKLDDKPKQDGSFGGAAAGAAGGVANTPAVDPFQDAHDKAQAAVEAYKRAATTLDANQKKLEEIRQLLAVPPAGGPAAPTPMGITPPAKSGTQAEPAKKGG
jgi:hypothetical protein